ncbi:glutamine--fructose-6-phosphate transaminase (isomerizing) [Thermodesulfatator autotrophicus]|uniref:Glutamine--fructose-6-phosphate aminotransferase [isomerizing] n=1 Tax=Thermodesulfatator autotrophicus TaxID=1795632 RepID=A0A177E8X5_9BACT|nr:glutamine--fructose-6-phosphate transaminase (isomerizing) [Thermodesulfatator autotrophicus]OAG27941.1 glutamine--fructose-6-phosphate aminotransferase [Thermodesulfatator autotrophicus]
MCGIIGYIGPRPVIPVLLEGLRRLEYRGYDSAGVAVLAEGRIDVIRALGKLIKLEEVLASYHQKTEGIGLGHTRWATHGEPAERNAHPHGDCKQELVVVHNGIIENYHHLRAKLEDKGHKFRSQTDTEVIPHLIEEELTKGKPLEEAVRKALAQVEGSYAVGVFWAKKPDKLVAARNQSPLVLGLGEGENFLASDIPALLPWTRKVLFLEDGELAVVTRHECKIFKLHDASPVERDPVEIKWDAAMAEKAGFKHFMLKEIYEQPQAILNTFRGRLDPETGRVEIPEIILTPEEIKSLNKICILACGTSYHAGLVGKYLFERLVRLPVEVELGSEFRYRDFLIDEKTLVIPISQSGETADTLASLRRAREVGAKAIAICNVLGSTITRESDGTIYTHAGPEIGVASTKAFTSQLTALLLLVLYFGEIRATLSEKERKRIAKALLKVPYQLEKLIEKLHPDIKELSYQYQKKRHFLYLGRNILFPIALEGALKLKEISYIHAEGYAAGEMKHGPIALIDEEMPVVALAPQNHHVYEKMISNIEEVRSRKGDIIALGTEGDETLKRVSPQVLELPSCEWEVSPILYTIPLQLLAYEVAVRRGCDVDQPRNLAKSVTVE